MKSMLIVLLITLSTISFANTKTLINTDDFNAMNEFRYNWVLNSERVFSDDLQQEDLYKVTFFVEGECAAWGEVDACEQIETCEYVWVDTSASKKEFYYPRFTNVACSADIEEVLEPILFDEL